MALYRNTDSLERPQLRPGNQPDSGRRADRYIVCQVIGWSTHTLLNISFVAMFVGIYWRRVAGLLVGGLIAAWASHLYRGWIKQRVWTSLRLGPAMLRAIPSSAAVGALVSIVNTVVLMWVFRIPGIASAQRLVPLFFVWISGMMFWAAIYFGVSYFRNYEAAELGKLQLQLVAREAQIQMLLTQINPHFVFNCLNSIRALVLENPEKAQQMVTELSIMLRYSLRSPQTQVSLRTEMEAVNSYINLERIRLEERLRCDIDVDRQALICTLPPMIVQMLVENAIKHGIATLPKGGKLSVSARQSEGRLRITVMNTGRLRENDSSLHIGLDNIRERLKLVYGGEAGFSIRNTGDNAVVAELDIPNRRPEYEGTNR